MPAYSDTSPARRYHSVRTSSSHADIRTDFAVPGELHRRVSLERLTLHYVEAGSGVPVVLLHGFPEFWYSWRHQIAALAAAGYRPIAPDLPGYNESDKPTGIASYRLELLVDDIARFIGAVAGGPAAVVGHDWGGVIAWELAMRRPELVTRLAILNAPHPAAFHRELQTPRQLLRSWYALFFQLPWLPEWLAAARNYALLRRLSALLHPGRS